MDAVGNLSFDVRQLISISEKLHNPILRGRGLNEDEVQVVSHCAQELLDLMRRVHGSPDPAVNLAHRPAETCQRI